MPKQLKMIPILLVLGLALVSDPAAAAQYYAQLDANLTVTRVVVIDDLNGADEVNGVDWCQHLFGGGVWVKTWTDGSGRKNYAGIGYSYDTGLDAFVPPRPFSSWVLDSVTAKWVPPVPYPTDGQLYSWDEPSKTWKVIAP